MSSANTAGRFAIPDLEVTTPGATDVSVTRGSIEAVTALADVATASREVAATRSRLTKTRLLAELLRRVDPDDVAVVVSWLAGDLPQRQIGVGWASLRTLPEPAAQPSLAVAAVHRTFDEIKATSGKGSKERRAGLLGELFGAATADEQLFLRRLLGGELRQGALLGVMTEAIAAAAQLPADGVRRAAMLRGDLPAVAAATLTGGAAALAEFRLQVMRPVGPMLAQSASSVTDALDALGGEAIFEAKLDGARLQIHRDGADVALYTRSLDDVTARLPEVVDAIRALPVRSLVADGEAIALRADGRPQPFQVTASRFGRRTVTPDQLPMSAFVFDVLAVDGDQLLDAPTADRHAILDRIVPPAARVDRLRTTDPVAAQAFLQRTLDAGHEGVMAKAVGAPYEAGRRGAAWLKVKTAHTLDLVVLAVEWGSGRRQGKLSNIHLGARHPDGGFVMLGKTFKGMTDEMLEWQTRRFTELADGPTDGYVVAVRPEQVVEIAFDGIQASTRYPGGMALRFARVLRYRDDKTAADADTVDTVRALFAAQHGG
ncbi:ATP-dependent DNA ligase [Mycobacterium sp. MYCO198283]|uniref:ATP-dependent DNA ligase n=1 Tax=Mycobacterium sp. MYCO198283 TaxID=2883505 RepID=UPI001E343381|nr:ATP-dependent DNA ligase [Mycobacterium sp. MYCO198283]MCG5430709.1 ATP-dependent DNA ligase [Mycobacterium sp. MYCO198283]